MVKNKNKIRNLVQYKNMSDEDFEQAWEDLNVREDLEDIDSRIDQIMNDFSLNYDLRDMNANDTLALRELAKTFVLLDTLGRIEQQAIEDGAVVQLRTLSQIKKEYLDNSSKLQEDLNIKRKQRQNDTGDTLDVYLPSILKKADNFYEERLAYIYCPKCKMLCANAWFTDWRVYNQIHITCPRPGCEHKFHVTSEYLTEHGNKNIEGVLPV